MDIMVLLIVGLVLVAACLVLLTILLVTGRSKETIRTLDATTRGLHELDLGLARLDNLMRDEFCRNREEVHSTLRTNREEQANSLRLFEAAFNTNVKDLNEVQRQKFAAFSLEQAQTKDDIDKQLKEIRAVMEGKLKAMQDDSAIKLEEMRKTVDEKLQETVEKRFSESFKLISDRLEQVHKGLGEMQTLASGVDDLKKVLGNVKTRGNLGEHQLGAILEQILSPEQFAKNAQTRKRSQERVEYVVKLPGKDDDGNELLLPIDSKFPVEDYERLLAAYEKPLDETVEMLSRRLETSIIKFARDIRDKYINPPVTTDFAIMFVPTEGLYAEVLRRPGLFERLQREFHVTVVGPTNLVAFLSSLQMGFRTLAIEKRSSEVWRILGAVKTEFGKFEGMLNSVKRKLEAASSEIDRAGAKSRNIGRKLRAIQELPQSETTALLEDSQLDGTVLPEEGQIKTAPFPEDEMLPDIV
ncbi:MAG: DNA recombination protein RmuC [Coriobacteriaceae bacterium]|nr:DNA recombination protein RmuC [Coriobacteriaceae bacterium]